MHISHKIAQQLKTINKQALHKVQSDQTIAQHIIFSVSERIQSLHPGAKDGKAILATAGPPGAGKSTFLAETEKYKNYRLIDPDEIKKIVLEKYLAINFFDEFLQQNLLDNKPVQPLELAGAVHDISSYITNIIAGKARNSGENIILDGTFKSSSKGKDILIAYMQSGYAQLDIVDVEVNLGQAARNAHERWWQARKNSNDPLGGRFVPPEIIWSLAGKGKYTRSLANAIATLQTPLPQASPHFTRTLIIQDKIIYNQPRIYQWERTGNAEIIATNQNSIKADIKEITQNRIQILKAHNQSLPKKSHTHAYAWCAICHRPIWHPTSILTGMGTTCRKKAGI